MACLALSDTISSANEARADGNLPPPKCLLPTAVCLLQVKKAQDDKVLLAKVMRDNDERLRAKAQAAAKEQEDDRRCVQSLGVVISEPGDRKL